ncbi:MAG TPA: tRNA-binding protein [Puia sp.]|jgi:tRNA-binding protein|nr:tRNA-binding protein [Puia sp.]
MPTIEWPDFEKIDIRVGTVVEVSDFPKAKKPAYQLSIDFGDLGIRKSSAQITDFYEKQELIGKQVMAVVNFPPKQIANFFSECLVLGVYTDKKEVVLIGPDRKVANGWKLG